MEYLEDIDSRLSQNYFENETLGNLDDTKNHNPDIEHTYEFLEYFHDQSLLDMSNNSPAALSLFKAPDKIGNSRTDLFSLHFEQLNSLTLEQVYALFDGNHLNASTLSINKKRGSAKQTITSTKDSHKHNKVKIVADAESDKTSSNKSSRRSSHSSKRSSIDPSWVSGGSNEAKRASVWYIQGKIDEYRLND